MIVISLKNRQDPGTVMLSRGVGNDFQDQGKHANDSEHFPEKDE